MSEGNQHLIATPPERKVEELYSARSFLHRGIEELSQTLRARAEAVRHHDSNSYFYAWSELAAWLSDDWHLLDETLDYMCVRGWAGKSGDPNTWWIA